MTKFHVGDKVRVHLPGNNLFDRETGYVIDARVIGATLYYTVRLDDTPQPTAFVERELRPAEIKAYDVD